MARVVKKPEVRREEIVSAAQDLFLRNEYEKTTLQDIMRKVKIAKGTIYHYFTSKEELLEAVVKNMAHQYVSRLRTILERVEGNAMERLQALIVASNMSNEQQEVVEQLHRPGNIGLHTRLLALMLTQMAPLYADLIRLGCAEGVFRTEHPLESAEFVLAGIQLITDVGFYPWNETDLKRRAQAVPALVEAQLGAAKGSFSFLNQA
jgi:AcrR family transcriptional regulator